MVGDESPPISSFPGASSSFETLQKSKLFQCSANPRVSAVQTAGGWLYLNRQRIVGPVIPYLRARFRLSALEAIEAAKTAHALEFPGA